MPTDCISYQNSGYFSPLMNDYLDQKNNLKELYNRFPTLENFEGQILEKQENFNNTNRNTLVSVLQKQYATIETSHLTLQNIEALKVDNTFTVTTGHQLNLFSGPLYFLYKIISTINLTKDLKAKYPAYNFVPIYWMATEDHDFEEINHFNFKGKKFRWNKISSGPVGRLSTEGLEEFLEIYAQELGTSTNAIAIQKLFQQAYLKHNNLADATRHLANALFGNYGLVILDADNPELKRNFIPFMKEELLQQTSHKEVSKTVEQLKEYFIQVNPREINLFYIEDNLRERIIFENEKYKVNHTKIEFSENEILELLDSNPEKFSPNVIMRPLYQEVILPNLCYIGGGGEIAYWLELKSFFDAVKITFPMLLVRNSALLTTEKQEKKAAKLGLSWADLFSKQADLVNKKTFDLSEFPIDLSIQKDFLKNQFHYLHSIAKKTDQSFSDAVKAQEAKQIKGLENLEKRLLKAQKRKYSDELERITNLQNELFPNKSLQERQANFSEFYLENGENLIPKLFTRLQALEQNFEIITL
ncbi:bacillithiol biosynthesis cysteine-adding enzyme BshC [Flavobacterium granuli]|uniref:Putative cysteine ligase BshC n=1 Tax=Flavobacterium granuli TaxID=280093 RepID=A0A1M5LGJ0_9FLAO|nr:bacillithiol biosynthesis cysteine-adding enzyme BshC [Flavobacterium granuli]PRZ23975.1 bacillithiol biosynthesis cysteine-adding enzyme BshC [Flavobacterium granuli]SHG64254.1 bacillithiol biosynthesis cysteine-adding enzyme BshC [Flavobacterium granuli]